MGPGTWWHVCWVFTERTASRHITQNPLRNIKQKVQTNKQTRGRKEGKKEGRKERIKDGRKEGGREPQNPATEVERKAKSKETTTKVQTRNNAIRKHVKLNK